MSNLIAFDIPEPPGEIAEWLESIICDGDLRGLVAQLTAVHGVAHQETELDPFLAEHRQAVLAKGLTALPASKLQSLLVTPTLLLELQEAIMAEGGQYWLGKFKSDAGHETVRQTDDAIAKALRNQQVAVGRPEKPVSRWSIPALLTLAAGLLIVMGGTWYWSQQRGERESLQVAAGWGWASESGVPSDVSAKDYLTALSRGADAWFNKRPTSKPELSKRLTEFSAGCEVLIHASHAPLEETDKAWLQNKCRGWKDQIDEQLAAADQSSFEEVLLAADNIARDISEALKQRASRV